MNLACDAIGMNLAYDEILLAIARGIFTPGR